MEIDTYAPDTVDEVLMYGDDMLEWPIDEPEIIEDDGMLINTRTGEIIGMIDRPADFVVDTPHAAAWVLSRLMHEEAQLGAIREQQDAINRNLEKMANARLHRIAWLQRRFGDAVAAVARAELAKQGGRSKTWRCAYGEVSFRLVKGTHKIVDMLAAVAWAKRVQPSIVRVVESVKVSDVLPLMDDGEAPSWLETTDGGERVSMKTGVAA